MDTASTVRPNGTVAARPLYIQVRDAIEFEIREGEWYAGTALPNEVILAERFGVSIGTIRKAVETLERGGLVVRRQGRGTFVAHTSDVRRRTIRTFARCGDDRRPVELQLVKQELRPSLAHESLWRSENAPRLVHVTVLRGMAGTEVAYVQTILRDPAVTAIRWAEPDRLCGFELVRDTLAKCHGELRVEVERRPVEGEVADHTHVPYVGAQSVLTYCILDAVGAPILTVETVTHAIGLAIEPFLVFGYRSGATAESSI
jgi:DNA-binding GntR family transcriptional regulator